ncbi:SDR family NAD(P)-dependent oxidoreductase [Cytophagales bacterium LB-30]|uniref:SDR family NAD(P)-dependent oxidoreductase n=1 Tax=Shiella aurantiaca TaxID=3058365 RepID=A0ABT8F3E0_9BACT|nr:SDR family NAD(P)-dependent oxidoreductase [Shiella aurantiaca]MDN4164930.1 SDR family NAD(P)-dependent oxidoreductase [Shiella aurantiaca]
MNVKGKVAVVTGSSKGIGLETVKILLEKGMKVAGWSRGATDISHPDFIHFPTDIGSWESVQRSYEQTVAHFKSPVQVLVNNAGLGYTGGIETMPVQEWTEMFNVNVHGIFYTSRLVVPEMKKLDEGHIINISSIAGTNGIEFMSGYCGTKHAVRGISHSMYKELRNFGIKVTCIYPGSVNTNFFDKIDSVTANENMMRPQDIAETIAHVLDSHGNYHHVDIEVRPLRPKGKPTR